jgi:uncharacterized damage-inducible protein DinB
VSATVDDHGRPEPPLAADEAATLLGFLDYQRATFRWKCAGVDRSGLALTVGASSLTLAGLLKHLAYVEDHWFRYELHGERAPEWGEVVAARGRGATWDWVWRSAADDAPEQLHAVWERAVDRSRAATEQALATGGLGHRAVSPDEDGPGPSLRWVLCHMVEEYARHNGHADLLREAVDGQTGE